MCIPRKPPSHSNGTVFPHTGQSKVPVALVWLPGCHFILYLLCLVVIYYFVFGFLAGGGSVCAIHGVPSALVVLVLVGSGIFTSVCFGMSYAFPSSLFRGLLIPIIMDSRCIFHKRFRFWFLRGWSYIVVYPSCSVRIYGWWHHGLFHYYIRFLWYEIGISKLPY